jgi:hypothetical protein
MPANLKAQQSGKIILRDSTIILIDKFTRLKTELYNYQRGGYNKNKEKVCIDIIKNYNLDKIREITFSYEKGKGTDQFYYLLIIEGICHDGSRYREKVKTWDWLEMSSPESGSTRNSEIKFFTEKKNLDLERIVFDF